MLNGKQRHLLDFGNTFSKNLCTPQHWHALLQDEHLHSSHERCYTKERGEK